jgi:cation transport regulator ChaB
MIDPDLVRILLKKLPENLPEDIKHMIKSTTKNIFDKDFQQKSKSSISLSR